MRRLISDWAKIRVQLAVGYTSGILSETIPVLALVE